ncbi:MAG: hypothetical protein HXX08_14170 [Chloroflexi bacterium]|uniref:DUF885 domain-containing protein n=1 Tax=Candidatus Chlorohelix allophototropha TaxID=3003348 RepID=A0A8T7M4J9_9CHLR|nr:hypothetical protein [Chloroflexota bacterium]WJW70002.1 hypothetical protein OZ401_004803 [Chloroflexota bacterium L227-S17]
MKFGTRYVRLSCSLALLLTLSLFTTPLLAADISRYFPETGHTVAGKFLQYWQANGGLATYGYPITDAQAEVDPETGKTFTMQWFERNRMELHSENAGTKYEVLLGLLGKDLNRSRLATDPVFQKATKLNDASLPQDQQWYFNETGHNLRGGFLKYWQENGGVERLGIPISEELKETDPETGKTFTVQWFERARFEYHPENQKPYDILLGLLGKQIKNGPTSNKAPAATGNGGNSYSIEQAISDNAQLATLAFDGLGFLTGNTGTDSFLPPGKVADFFGFQYLRDVTQAGKGHSTDFVTNAANNVLYTLNDTQKAKLIALAKTQTSLVNDFAYKRFPLMVAFRRQLTGNIPTGSSGLSKSAVIQYSSDLYELDAKISIQRAELYAGIIKSLSSQQTAYLDNMLKGGFASWPALADQVDKKSLSHDEDVLVMSYASDILSWYGGNVEADTYFCPERQGDYFGGFYIKDAPAIGNAGYTIDESITGDKGQEFIDTLDSTQKPVITSIVNTQKPALTGIVSTRRAIATELRKALAGGTIDEASVITLSRSYGALDGEISYYYATAFAQVGKTLTATQKQKLMGIRDLDNYPCPDNKAYLYSDMINMPIVANTDFLFS